MYSPDRPTVLIDKEKCLRNIRRAVAKAGKEGVILRPHFKTHQSAEVGQWYRGAGVDRITVSSVEMARYFAGTGWEDILLSIPVNILEWRAIGELAKKISLSLFIADPEAVHALGMKIPERLNIMVEIDTGQHRSGILPDDRERIDSVLAAIEAYPHFHFTGFATHAGHSYSAAGDLSFIQQVHNNSMDILARLKETYRVRYPALLLSAGDSPTFSLARNFSVVDEVRPGNLVFYDLTQAEIGSCREDEIAVVLAAPVLSVYPERQEAVIYGGAVHLSKDFLLRHDGSKSFGKVYRMTEEGWEPAGDDIYIKSLSQEHGLLATGSQAFRVGEILAILPVHSCLTCDLAHFYYTTEGERLETMRSTRSLSS